MAKRELSWGRKKQLLTDKITSAILTSDKKGVTKDELCRMGYSQELPTGTREEVVDSEISRLVKNKQVRILGNRIIPISRKKNQK